MRLTDTSHRTALHPRSQQSLEQRTDDQWVGDSINNVKKENQTRILFHNVNGFKNSNSGIFQDLLYNQQSFEIDIQCISEHQRDTTKSQVTQNLQEETQKAYPGQTILQIDSSQSTSAQSYKPGGTAILAMGDIVGRLEPKGRGGDAMGRWSYITLRRRNNNHLTVISAYQVCKTPTNIIGNTAWHQQRLALNTSGRTQDHPRKAFADDLVKFIAQLIGKKHDIIVGGDFNETLEDINSGLLRIATTTQLVDPWNNKFAHHPPFNTQIMGSKRIDSVLISPGILCCITKIGYAPFGFFTTSDHRALVLECDTKMLFGDVTDRLIPPQFRGVRAQDRQAVTK